MKRVILWPLLVMFLSACATGAAPSSENQSIEPGTAVVEIAFLNHPPVRSVLTDVDDLLATYGDRVSVVRYDFDTPEGESFAQARGLTEHTPLAIFVNGSMEFAVGGRTVAFYSFPQSQGTGAVPDGNWTLEDLRHVLDEATSESP